MSTPFARLLILATMVLASPAAAIDDEPGAALALPFITGGQAPNPLHGTGGDVIVADDAAITLNTVTNATSSPIRLVVEALSGDPEGGWTANSFTCDLAANETTSFLIMPDGDRAELSVECADLSTPFGFENTFLRLGGQNGVLFVAVADPASGKVVSSNVLFGDTIVVDIIQGQAYSFGAAAFQAGLGANDGDKVFRFDTREYTGFATSLAGDFIAPVPGSIQAQLIVFTLDGTTGADPAPRVKLAVRGVNDDEELVVDTEYEFDCFDIVSLEDIHPDFLNPGFGTLAGHIELTSLAATTTSSDPHDALFGNGNDRRRRGVVAFLVQGFLPGALLVPQAAGPAASGRPLLPPGVGALPPDPGDLHFVLNANDEPCPCFSLADQISAIPLICYASPGPSTNTFAYFTPPPRFLQTTDRWCRANASFALTSPGQSQACDASLQCLCSSSVRSPELACNGKDDDCDPSTSDEPSAPCLADDQVGALQRRHSDAQMQAPSSATRAFRSPRLCGNGLDDDCDLTVDESDTEACDGFDNDCDGEIDEDLGTIPCDGSAVDSCVDGIPQECDEMI